MDFHAFKRSEALLSPVCLWAGTVKTHQFLRSEAWRAMWLSLYLAAFSPLSIHANASIRGNFQHSPDQSLKQSPMGEQWKAFPALPLSFFPAQAAKRTCYPPPRETGEKVQGRRRGNSSYTHSSCYVCLQRQGRSLQTGACYPEHLCQHKCLLMLKTGSNRDKASLWQSRCLLVVWAVMRTTEKHP